jgi:hypothetical protein
MASPFNPGSAPAAGDSKDAFDVDAVIEKLLEVNNQFTFLIHCSLVFCSF